jgi:hypothetical protein
VATVKPTVRPPSEGVQRLVRVAFVVPTVEENLRFAGGLGFIAILNRNEHQIGRGADPHAAKTDFDSTDQIELFHEYSAAVEFSVAVRVFENEDAVLARRFLSAPPVGVLRESDR